VLGDRVPQVHLLPHLLYDRQRRSQWTFKAKVLRLEVQSFQNCDLTCARTRIPGGSGFRLYIRLESGLKVSRNRIWLHLPEIGAASLSTLCLSRICESSIVPVVWASHSAIRDIT
jgi:hypothetical protein